MSVCVYIGDGGESRKYDEWVLIGSLNYSVSRRVCFCLCEDDVDFWGDVNGLAKPGVLIQLLLSHRVLSLFRWDFRLQMRRTFV